jgi:hypothetical protein
VTARRGAAAVLLVLLSTAATAHEVRPAYLQIQAADDEGIYRVLWKRPLVGNRLLPIAPVFPDQCSAASTAVDTVLQGALVQRFELRCPAGLHGETVAIEGLATTITDVMLHAALEDGTQLATLLRPDSPSAVLGTSGTAVLGYLVLGVEHLLLGFDHILFVLCLMYFTNPVFRTGGRLAVRPGALVKTVTAFTVAHSITLSFAVLGLARAPQAPVEAVIALSILFLAVEKLRGVERSITAHHTWLVAFVFGLLHGFGFAGALTDIGLPPDNVPAALFLFNVGVEIGQLGIVAVAIVIAVLFLRRQRPLPQPFIRAPLYVSGCLAAYWLVERTAGIVLA